jgi:hypothetical protein
MENKNSQVLAGASGAVGGAWQQNPPAELELVQKYQNEIRETIINAVKSVRSCVLFYRDIYYELEDMFEDREMFKKVEGALRATIDGLKLGDITLYRIYAEPDESFNGVIVVTFGRELSEEQLRVLREVASLFGTDFYDAYSEGEEQFFEAMPLYFSHREEVYVTLHNLVKKWTGCGKEDE